MSILRVLNENLQVVYGIYIPPPDQSESEDKQTDRQIDKPTTVTRMCIHAER